VDKKEVVKMQKKGWKVLAIILLIVVIAETGLIVWAYNKGVEDIRNEEVCAYEICEEYNSYQYDSYYQICYCFEDNEIVKTKYI